MNFTYILLVASLLFSGFTQIQMWQLRQEFSETVTTKKLVIVDHKEEPIAGFESSLLDQGGSIATLYMMNRREGGKIFHQVHIAGGDNFAGSLSLEGNQEDPPNFRLSAKHGHAIQMWPDSITLGQWTQREDDDKAYDLRALHVIPDPTKR